jgi:DUF4097 and DUF4098 domain-containing protein YvlB
MKTRSITGPVLLVIIGFLFLVNNIWRDLSFWRLAWDYWPILLIVIGVIGLVEALYHASQGVANPPRPLSGGGIFWIVILLAGFSWMGHGNVHIGPFTNTGLNSVLGSDFTYDVNKSGASEGVTRVVLDNLHGNLSLKGEDGGEVKVTGRKTVRAFSQSDADTADKQSPLVIVRDGDILYIRTEEPKSSHTLSVTADLDITVPKGLDVETRGRSGDLVVDDISGEVSVLNGRGDIRLSNVGKDVKIDSGGRGLIRATDIKGKVDLKGSGGDVQIENVQGPVSVEGEYSGTLEFHALAKEMHLHSSRSEFRVEAIPGNVTLDLGDLKMKDVTGPVRFTTGTRDVDATDVTNGLEISLNRGDIQVTETKLALPKLDVHTHNGEVTLSIPEKAAFDLDGTTARGEVNNDFGDFLKTTQEGRAASIRGKQGNGPELKVGTDRGTLTVKKN